MYYLKHIWVKFKYNPFAKVVLDGLSKMGIRVSPYYIVSEGLFNTTLPDLEEGFDGYDLSYLGVEDMREISLIPGPDRPSSEKDLLLRLKQGKKCLGIKHKGQIVTFTWFDLVEFRYRFYRFSLKVDEAYLFDAYTVMSFRGEGIAPYVRYQCYKELAKLGRNKLYSVSERFHSSSIRFKMKLNAKLLKQGLYVELFNKWYFNLRLKRYRIKLKNNALE